MDGLLALAPTHELAARWRALRGGAPGLTLADAAARLEVSEAELVASACGDEALRLDGPFGDLVRALPELGVVRAVTRNPHAMMETLGRYPAPDAGCAGAVGKVGARFFLEHWRFGYVLDEVGGDGLARRLRFFDDRGAPVHEIAPTRDSNAVALGRLVDLFASFDQSPGERLVCARTSGERGRPAVWLRQATEARPVASDVLGDVLAAVVRDAIPVSLAVHSRGVVQRCSGPLDAMEEQGTAALVRAPGVHAAIRRDGIAEAWVVRSASLDGPTTSLALLDRSASVVASLSGARWPGRTEPAAWRALLDGLPTVA